MGVVAAGEPVVVELVGAGVEVLDREPHPGLHVGVAGHAVVGLAEVGGLLGLADAEAFLPAHMPREQVDVVVVQPSSVIQMGLSPSPWAAITSCTERKPRNVKRATLPSSR